MQKKIRCRKFLPFRSRRPKSFYAGTARRKGVIIEAPLETARAYSSPRPISVRRELEPCIVMPAISTPIGI